MSASKYVRFGLRADKNLDDLPDPNVALSNILDDLVPDVTFTPQDLKVIDDIQLTDVYASDLSKLAGNEITYRSYVINGDGSVSPGNPVPVEPTITMKDRIVNRKVILGDPPYGLGGSGPNSTVAQGSALQASSYANDIATPPTGDTIINNSDPTLVTDEDYWIDGRFAFGAALHPSFDDTNGAIQWEGYLAWPTGRDIRVNTNGFFLIEVDRTNTNNWELVTGTWAEEFTVTCANTTGPDATDIEIASDDITKLFLGMRITVDDDSNPATANSQFEISNINTETNIITIQPTETATAVGVDFQTNDEISIRWSVGQTDIDTGRFELEPQFKGETKHYRFTSWWPNPSDLGKAFSTYRSKYVIWDAQDSGSDDFMPYVYWYKSMQGQGTPSQFTYEYFKKNKVGPENANIQKIIENEKPVFIRYNPVTDSAGISRYNSGSVPTTKSLVWNGDYSFSALPEESLGSVQVGDFLLFADDHDGSTLGAISYYLHIYERQGNTIFVNPSAHSDIVTIMEDQGAFRPNATPYEKGDIIPFHIVSGIGLTYIGLSQAREIIGASGEQDYNIVDTSNSPFSFNALDIKPDNLVFTLKRGAGGESTKLRRIVEVTGQENVGLGSAQFGTHPIAASDPAPVTDVGDYVLVYSHRGLNDNSISTQCVGVYGKENATFPVVPTGTTQIWVYDIEGISVGDVVQYPGFIPGYNPAHTGSDPNQDGTNVTTVTNINTTPTDSGLRDPSNNPILLHSITISRALMADLPNAYTLIFIKSGNLAAHTENNIVQDKNYCVLPLNTAPPFLGNDEGLATSLDYPHLKINGDLTITGFELSQASVRDIGSAGYTQASQAEATGGYQILEFGTNKRYWLLSK